MEKRTYTVVVACDDGFPIIAHTIAYSPIDAADVAAAHVRSKKLKIGWAVEAVFPGYHNNLYINNVRKPEVAFEAQKKPKKEKVVAKCSKKPGKKGK